MFSHVHNMSYIKLSYHTYIGDVAHSSFYLYVLGHWSRIKVRHFSIGVSMGLNDASKNVSRFN